MSTSTKPFSIVTFQDGSVAVVRSDPRTPRVLEVIAVFFEAERARDYADRENSRSAEPAASRPRPRHNGVSANCGNTGTERAPKRGVRGAPCKDG